MTSGPFSVRVKVRVRRGLSQVVHQVATQTGVGAVVGAVVGQWSVVGTFLARGYSGVSGGCVTHGPI